MKKMISTNTIRMTTKTFLSLPGFALRVGFAIVSQYKFDSSEPSAQWSQPSQTKLWGIQTWLLMHWNSPRLQHKDSSWPSGQFVVPSQTKLFSMHSPVLQLKKSQKIVYFKFFSLQAFKETHRNWSALHVGQSSSSLLSGQSFAPSHRHADGMQSLLWSIPLPFKGDMQVKKSGPQAGRAPQFLRSLSNIKPCGHEHISSALLLFVDAMQMCEHLFFCDVHRWFLIIFASGYQTDTMSVMCGYFLSKRILSPFVEAFSRPNFSSSQ